MWLLNHSENCSQWIHMLLLFSSLSLDFFLFCFIGKCGKKFHCKLYNQSSTPMQRNEWGKKCDWNKLCVVLTGDDYSKYWKQLKRWQQRYRTLKWCSCIRTAIMTLGAAPASQLYDPVVSVNHIKFRNHNFNLTVAVRPAHIANIATHQTHIFNRLCATKTPLQPNNKLVSIAFHTLIAHR